MKEVVRELLSEADIELNGDSPWDIQVHDKNFYQRVMAGGSLALGETYMEGYWDCADLEEFFYRILTQCLDEEVSHSWWAWWYFLKAKLVNLQSRDRAFEVGEKHYDRGNRLYENMLDSRMNYSCGYWRAASDLEEAQEDKLDLICRKLKLEPGLTIVDIGCGWGGLARYAAENYGVEVVGLTVSREQMEYARQFCQGLPVEIRLQDYRALEETFDRVVSVGMFEHVGAKNYGDFMEVAARGLKPDGLFLLHTIGTNLSLHATDPWIHKYIFPNGMLPSPPQVTDAAEELFMVEDWHNFGPDYVPTLRAWHENFETAWPDLKKNYDRTFYRMWRYYLLICAASFRARRNHLWQIVFSPRETERKDYHSVR